MPGHTSDKRPRPLLGLFDTISLAVGIVVGVAIFKVPAGVFRNVADPWHGLAAWPAARCRSSARSALPNWPPPIHDREANTSI